MQYIEGELVASSNSGRFAIDNENGRDLSSGNYVEIKLGGEWIPGTIEHATEMYPLERSLQEIMSNKPIRIASGYYFISKIGRTLCGLCVGMVVRVEV